MLCFVCGKIFRYTRNLNTHIQDVHGKKENDFQCSECEMSFKKRHLLNKHKRIHDTSKRYSCHICDKSFTRKWDLERHISSCHDKIIFKCDFCARKFNRHDNLLKHLKSNHK